ncbi:hypothetical protein DICPUDRAFT_96696 [Dictyostelium purpureum]|uniref:Uncharacterized protein n=1 Tax=Dictyostelium purpureum TaxID=5786 RepID=F0ZAJ4_DICPU|nr:uncharacterized protein DICPUDRAFT_96696 [Dictyostelium purpureum]EGC39011.1 hypothetical protein DICPUDRAFT_96696 [Dictyostelium purpureum]|eukprot:XP_003284464.1 hypothetical protein DICPUDRAFT_96696 [Dictyostelium purpureum]
MLKILTVILLGFLLLKLIKCELIKELIKIDEYDDVESKGNIIYKTNSNNYVIFSSFEGNLYKMQVNSREIEVKRNFKSLFYLNQKSSGFFDEVNNIFYLATQTNYTSIQISVFNSLNLNYINSFFIYNEMLPFIDNSLTLDDNNQIILITPNNIIKIEMEINY